MRELSLSQNFALIALNAQDSCNMTTVKKIALRCIAAAIVLEVYLDEGFDQIGDEFLIEERMFDSDKFELYQEVLFKTCLKNGNSVKGNLKWWLKKVATLRNSQLIKMEKAIVDSLKGMGIIEEIPNLLGCDLLYKDSGVIMKEYRSNVKEYTRITESTRAEILEEGPIYDETIAMIWLLRESGCLHDVFSNKELEGLSIRINNLYESEYLAKIIFEVNIHETIELIVKNFLDIKKRIIKSEVGTGVNFIFPMIDRSQSIFIETEAWFENSNKRLEDIKKCLENEKHQYTVLREGKTPLIKIDNILYEAVPDAINSSGIAIHGIRLRKYPI